MKRYKKMEKKRIAAALFLLILGAALYIGLRQEKDVKVIFVLKTQDNIDFWNSLVEGAQMAADEYGAEYEWMAPIQEKDVDRQKELIREAIEKAPDVIALAPVDEKQILPEAKKIKEAGITLVLIDSKLSEDIADCTVSTDNYEAGRELGEYALSICSPEEKIGIVSHVKGSSTAKEREKGVQMVLEEDGREIVQTVYGESNYSIAYDETKKMLEAHPEITVIVGTNEYATVGAARLIKDMGLKGKVKIVGFDNSKEEIQMLESGVIEGLVIQRAFDMGYLGIKLGIETEKGEKQEANVDSGCKLVTRETIYTKENQKLLFPVHTGDD